MTKKDYELIASVLYGLYLGHADWQRSGRQVIQALCDTFADKNPRFDRDKFLKACGL